MARVLPCVAVVELLTEYLDDALPRRTRRAVVRHLATCTACSRLLAQLHDVVRRLAGLHEPVLPPSVHEGLRGAFRAGPRER